jgi:hypothetical protein
MGVWQHFGNKILSIGNNSSGFDALGSGVVERVGDLVGAITEITSCRSRASRKSASRCTWPRMERSGEGTFVRRVFELDSIRRCPRSDLCAAFGYDYVPGLVGALALTQAGERARRIEVGYFVTRSGHGDELRCWSTLRDAFTLTSGGTQTTLVGSARRGRIRLTPAAP